MVRRDVRERCYRIISALLPRLDIFERIVAAEDLPNVIELEALTNPRLRDVAGAIAVVPAAERVTGPGASFIMAPFAYPPTTPMRFLPALGRGVYYAASTIAAAIAETVYHRERFLASTREPTQLLQMRVIDAMLEATVIDADLEENAGALRHPDDYTPSCSFAAAVDAEGYDGVTWTSVRDPDGGRCYAIYRANCLGNAHTERYLEYRWNGTRIDDVRHIVGLSTPYPDEPGAA